jgi:hypothetical protein
MKRKIWLLALVGAVLLSGSPLWADGDFYVVAAGGGVGTKITSLPKEITLPGFYYLTGNLTYSGDANGIDVKCDDVTIDLMGFRLYGPDSGSSINAGIELNAHKNVEIRNGTLRGWYIAIRDQVSGVGRNRAFNIRVENGSYGIQFTGTANMIKGCISQTTETGILSNGGTISGNVVANNYIGIAAQGTISGNSTTNCTYGIGCSGASTIIHNTIVTTTTSQTGIWVYTTEPNLLMQNTASGPGTRLISGAGTIKVSNAGF